MSPPITSFRGRHHFLSNFSRSLITIKGIQYPTVEHAFQAMKTLDTDVRRHIAGLPTPGAAKGAGRRVLLRPGWDGMRIQVMRGLLVEKFSDLELASRLVETGDAELIEENLWGDRFWGQVCGVGLNHLGQLLMEVRAGLL